MAVLGEHATARPDRSGAACAAGCRLAAPTRAGAGAAPAADAQAPRAPRRGAAAHLGTVGVRRPRAARRGRVPAAGRRGRRALRPRERQRVPDLLRGARCAASAPTARRAGTAYSCRSARTARPAGFAPPRPARAGRTLRIDVDLSARRLTLFRAGHSVLAATVAVGARRRRRRRSAATTSTSGSSRPTRAGPYGPGAIGISAFSTVLTGWAQGGPVAIHGTNEPWSIGHAVSNGCIRLPNATLERLFGIVAAGDAGRSSTLDHRRRTRHGEERHSTG